MADPEPFPRSARVRRWPWFVVALLAAGLLAAIVRLAWLGDDAYITLRTVENVLAGHGPVWNVGERVQTYTHPAWFGLLVAMRWLGGDAYFGTLVLSLVCVAAGVAWLARTARHPAAIAVVLVALLGSRAFVDYATSGLESPLAILLLAWLAFADERTPPGGTRLVAIGGLTALLGTTRLDLLVLAGPLLLGHLRWRAPLQQLRRLGVALAPLLAWSLFAAFYYGSPFPITAYAKAFATGIPAGDLGAQGLCYVAHTLRHDPVTLLVIAAGIVSGLVARSVRGRLLAIGVLLAFVYVVRVGGDFMAGRFFVAPFVVALALLARGLARVGWPLAIGAAAIVIAVALVPGSPKFLQPIAADLAAAPDEDGIVDERRFWYARLGLFSPQRDVPVAGRFTSALRRQGRERPLVLGIGPAGALPFEAGDLFHFVDPWLCDPLLMRLPAAEPTRWRIGHFTRAWPEGYAASLAAGDNCILDPDLARYYATLQCVLRAPPWAPDRLRALWRLLSGAAEPERSAYALGAYRQPPRVAVQVEALAKPVADGTFWFDAPTTCLPGRGGVRIVLPAARTVLGLRATVMPMVRYSFAFRAGDREVGRCTLAADVPLGLPPTGDDADLLGYLRGIFGMRSFAVPLPPGLPAFDAIDVDTQHDPWTPPAIGALEFSR